MLGEVIVYGDTVRFEDGVVEIEMRYEAHGDNIVNKPGLDSHSFCVASIFCA